VIDGDCTGSAISKRYNNQLSATIGRSMALDIMVDFFHDEAEYWQNIVSDKRLWG
jgi:hypothetical protein